jgi:hypothetical protein
MSRIGWRLSGHTTTEISMSFRTPTMTKKVYPPAVAQRSRCGGHPPDIFRATAHEQTDSEERLGANDKDGARTRAMTQAENRLLGSNARW